MNLGAGLVNGRLRLQRAALGRRKLCAGSEANHACGKKSGHNAPGRVERIAELRSKTLAQIIRKTIALLRRFFEAGLPAWASPPDYVIITTADRRPLRILS
jgi:hypothetical protein